MEEALREVLRHLERRHTDDSCVMMKYILRFWCGEGFRVNSPSHVGVSGRTNHVPGKSLVLLLPGGNYCTVTYYPTARAGSSGYISMQLLVSGDRQDTDEARRLLWDIFIRPPPNTVISDLRGLSSAYQELTTAEIDVPATLAEVAAADARTTSVQPIFRAIDCAVAFHDGLSTLDDVMAAINAARAAYTADSPPVNLLSEINQCVLAVSPHAPPQITETAHAMYRMILHCGHSDEYADEYLRQMFERSQSLNRPMPYDPSRVSFTVSNIQMRIMARPAAFINVQVFENPFVPIGMRNLPRAALRAGNNSSMHYRIFQPDRGGSFIGVNFIGGRLAAHPANTEIPEKPHRFITVGATGTEMARAVIYAVAMALISTLGAIALSVSNGNVYDRERTGSAYRIWEPGTLVDPCGVPIVNLEPRDVFISSVFDEPPTALVHTIRAGMQRGDTVKLRRRRVKRERASRDK